MPTIEAVDKEIESLDKLIDNYELEVVDITPNEDLSDYKVFLKSNYNLKNDLLTGKSLAGQRSNFPSGEDFETHPIEVYFETGNKIYFRVPCNKKLNLDPIIENIKKTVIEYTQTLKEKLLDYKKNKDSIDQHYKSYVRKKY